MNKEPIIKVKNFKMKFGGNEVIKDLSFEVYKGEVFGLLGSNGSGKTTTIRALLGLFKPTAGELLVNGKKFSPDTNIKIGYLPEERGLYKKEKVSNIMHYFAELKGLDKKAAKKWIDDFLTKINLSDKAGTRLDKLSSGQQQKIQLGITIMGQPDLLILDEPTKGFDPVNRQLLLNLVEQERQRGATVLMITHQMEEAERLCDRVLLLKDGRAKVYGRVEDIKDKAGENRIKINFNGKLPTTNAPFTILESDKTRAELVPKAKKTTGDVLRYLIDQKLELRSYSVERPSLDEIFIKTYNTKVGEEQNA